MTTLQPQHIVCAVRGGIESRETATRAIDLALDSGVGLTFLHVLDAEFLEYATIGPLSVVYQELAEMGKFAMIILRDRAQRRGVEQVDYVVREGNIRKQLHLFAIETHADVMVVGRPAAAEGRNVFKESEFDEFIAELALQGGLRIIAVP